MKFAAARKRSEGKANLRRTFRSPYSGNFAMWVEGESFFAGLSFFIYGTRPVFEG
jgi:hypothetical protein